VKIINVVGARPNLMKIAPIMHAYKASDKIDPLLVHTGQHYDENMSDLFFRQLGIPEPDLNLEVGSSSHAIQTADIMRAFETIVLDHQPDAVLVVGDVNSTIACGIVAVKLGIKLIHVEAGLRSGDRTMPEEINRLITDSISDILFCTEQSGIDNLRREGVPDEKVHLVGNVMIDTLLQHQEKANASTVLDDLGLQAGNFAVLTLHRPSNVDNRELLDGLIGVLEEIQNDLPVIFPIHPRTRSRLQDFGFTQRLESMNNLHLLEPVGYLDFLKLTASAKLVLTDSGGIQEETTILKVPCLTLRENTERPVTLEVGSNQLVGTDPRKILAAYHALRDAGTDGFSIPPLWDGHAAERIVEILETSI
jgi:UDP-N-acetylglucosamine 2-epimerase (non-hydrolysing)